MLSGNVLITGGSGFLGRSIMRQASRQSWPCNFTVYSRNEQLQALCKVKYPNARYVLGDVRETERLALVMSGHDYVIHAAAMKFIPEAELNAAECVSVNIDGARSVISAARAADVRRVVGVSTDKAASPVNIYGMSKAVMERLFADQVQFGYPYFTTCRYGNVIGSTGSVVPVMRQQLLDHGVVRITDPDMTRFWMNAEQAVATILQALDGPNGATVIPKPHASTMMQLAYAVLEMSGHEKSPTKVEVIGRRPGEKMHEDLISQYELLRTLRRPDWYYILPPGNENYTQQDVTVSSDRAELVTHDKLCAWIFDSEGI